MNRNGFGFAVTAAFALLGGALFAADAVFTTLPLCRRIDGSAEVRLPNGDWDDAEEGKFYPLGSSFRTKGKNRLVVAFGADSTVSIEGNSSFGTRLQQLGEKSRTVTLAYGTVELNLAENLAEGSFFVAAPGFIVKNPAGSSRITYEETGDGDKATVRCVTGVMGVQGRHFEIPAMRVANEVVIRTSHDHLSTILFGTSGDYAVRLDQGVRMKEEISDEGKTVAGPAEKMSSEWRLTPKTRVVINRALPAIGSRMSVHTMAFDAAGSLKSECSFCEGRAEVNSGELVKDDKLDGDELAKRAAEATETTEATDAEDASDEGEKKEDDTSSEE